MAHQVRRSAAACLAAVLLVLAAAPVAAVDPTPAPTPEPPDAGDATSPPSIHAEMESEYATTPISFVSGVRPTGLRARGVDGGEVQAEAAGLPNGLSHEVFGYLPYWAVTDPLVAHLDYDLLSTIAYFGVPALSNGTLQKTGTGWNGWTSATMTDVINEAHAEGVKVVLTVTMMAWDFDYAEMSAVLNSAHRRNKLATDIAATVAARNADGVNLDFEPMPNSLQASYTAFVRAVRTALGSGSYLTVATTGGAASWDEGYDLAGLTASDAANALMVMAYDLNWSGSARAGGVAPIDSPYALDSREAMAAYRARVPSSKLIWGVPYYGRAWTTTTKTLNGRTCRSAGGCTAASWAMRYVDAIEGAADYGRRWDATGQVPWYTYRSSTYGTHVQAYYDDAQSLDVKYEMVGVNGLRGVGIWHLLMDVGRRALWDQLWRNFGDLPFRDVDDSNFLRDIIWIADAGITTGCGVDRFCPSEAVSRGQMATFLDRAFNPPGPAPDRFTDDDRSVHEPAINRIAKAGITTGCGRGRFCPDREVTRGQMATFLDRALDLPSTPDDFFDDDEGSPHERAINRVAAAGITTGCGSGNYCPDRAVRREQMAAFLHRALTR